MKCSICGKKIVNNLAVSLDNHVMAGNHKTIKVQATICKDCITNMYNHLNDLEKNKSSTESIKSLFFDVLNSHFAIFLMKINNYLREHKLDTISIHDAMIVYKQYMQNLPVTIVSDSELGNCDEDIIDLLVKSFGITLSDSLQCLYATNEYVDLAYDQFKTELNEIFDGFMYILRNSVDEDLFLTDLDKKSANEKAEVEAKEVFKLSTPSQIKKELDKSIIGQEKAKKIMAVGIYNHYKRIQTGKTDIKKSNIMLVGPTGCGKTEIARTVASILDVPFCIADATSITEAGYVGDDAENMLLKLIQAADGDIAKAEKGIIYIDEIDKIARHGEGRNNSKDVGGEGVQQALLKIIEGNEITISVKSKRNPFGDNITINTENILFIGGGAFESLTMAEKTVKHTLGFMNTAPTEDIEEKTLIDSKALMKFGLIPELIGRFPIIAKLDALTVDDLKRILVEPKNSVIKQYTELVGIDKVKLNFTNDALKWIANKSYEDKTGARGLKTVLEDSMLDLMYDLPDEADVESVQIGVKNGQLDIRKKQR